MKNFYLAMLLAPALICSCSGKEPFPWNRDIQDTVEQFSHDMIVLGEKLQDPYSVENMTRAFESVYPTKAGRGSLEATDFYVRFLPKDDAQMQQLTDLGLKLLDHPLDYRILRDGDWYHDPEVPEGSFTWQYAVVPVNFEFPKGVRYERLEDCYLSEHDPVTKSDGIDWEAVEREAFRISGNADLLLPLTRTDEPVNPEGYITILDPDYSAEPVGVKGVEVCCNSFVKIATGYTDEYGHYRLNRSYSSELRYRLVFRNIKGFCQGLNMILVPASVSALGKHPAEGCTLTVDSSSDAGLFARCVINNAGYDYIRACENSAGALPMPPKNFRVWDLPLLSTSFNIMMHQGVILETFDLLHDLLGIYTFMAKTVQADAYLGIDACGTYNEAYQRALLVFAQAGHFTRVGKDWWQRYVSSAAVSMTGNTISELIGAALDSDMSYMEVVHTYSSYCQNVLYRRHYPESDELFSSNVYSPQLLLYLDSRGLNLEMLSPLFSSDVVDMEILKQKMLSYYPQFKTIIGEAFARYAEN